MFNEDLIKTKFQKMGSDVRFTTTNRLRRRSRLNQEADVPLTVDVETVRNKERFVISYDDSKEFELSVADLQPKDRHLLLMIKNPIENRLGNVVDNDVLKILCGHDERHWFSAGIPESARAATVEQAKLALVPKNVANMLAKCGYDKRVFLKRKGELFVRQGEWYFIRMPDFKPDNEMVIKKKEPISRGGGSKPHMCDELYSIGGQRVYVNDKYAPDGVTEGEYRKLVQKLGRELGWEAGKRVDFQVRTRDAAVYARGGVRHKDHKTIYLDVWHRVFPNTESESRASTVSVFLD